MAASTTSQSSGSALLAPARRAARIIGFTKTYNLVLFLVLGGAVALFTIFRLELISINKYCLPGKTIPGDCFQYHVPGQYQTGIWLHLASILPGTLLALFQFVPGIRRRALAFHRYNGYLVYLLSVTGSIGVMMIMDKAAGGNFDTQAIAVTLTIAFLGSTIRAWYAIKQLRIDQHRAWMLRSWGWAWCIVTMRPIYISMFVLASLSGNMYTVQHCGKIEYVLNTTKRPHNMTLASSFPECGAYLTGEDTMRHAVVKVDVFGDVIQKTAATNVTFGSGVWVAWALHAFLIELYLHYTSDEAERLKKFSHQKRLQAGLVKPTEEAVTNGQKKTA